MVAVFLILMYYFDLYDSFVLSNRREVVTRLVGVLGCAFVALAVLYYAFPEISLGGSTLWIGVAIRGGCAFPPGAAFFCAESLRPLFRAGHRLRRRPSGGAADGGDRPPRRTGRSGRGLRRQARRPGRRHSSFDDGDLDGAGQARRRPARSWSPWATAAANCKWKSCSS